MKRSINLSGFIHKHSFLCMFFIILTIILTALFYGDNVGMSNNGDFQRVMNASSIKMVNTDAGFLYDDTYSINLAGDSTRENVKNIMFSSEGIDQYPSFHVFFTRISVILNIFANKLTGQPADTYSLSILGIMHALLYALVLAIFLSQIRFRKKIYNIIFIALSIIILCDIGYISYFNSFYGEGLQHIAFLLCVAMTIKILNKPPKIHDMILAVSGAIIYGWSKFFNIPIALIFVLVYMIIYLVRTKTKPIPVISAAVGILCLFCIYTSIPKWMDVATNYNSVFYGVMHEVGEEKAQEYADALELPSKLADYRDTNYYVSWVSEALQKDGLEDAVNSLSKPVLIKFYLTHPVRLAQLMPISASHSDMVRPYYLSNYSNENHPRMTLSHKFSIWSALRTKLPLGTVWGNLIVLVAFLTILCYLFKKQRNILITLTVSTSAVCLYSFIAPIAFNGIGDLAKHQFAFIETLDLLLIGVMGFILATVSQKKTKLSAISLAALLIFAFITPALTSVSGSVMRNKSHDRIETGSYIALGSQNGQSILWQVIDTGENILTLASIQDVAHTQYSTENSNDWKSSSIRSWLNGEFLNSFDSDELAMIIPHKNKITCTMAARDNIEHGKTELLCSHIPAMTDMNYDNAFSYTCDDTVRLPDVGEIASMHKNGYLTGGEYWLETSYALNGYFNRFISKDGYVLFAQANREKGVRPIIEISSSAPLEGHGSIGSPFVLTKK